ncbi:DUF4189 domain-containing protein [Pseudomonas marginalis]|uniref:DUF4189 domain-containing protein n=1 Tax=Pseudomonas marginalis TaxID=298 RepID=UPI0009BAAED7
MEGPQPSWVEQWQAIATDASKGVMGVSTYQPSPDASVAAAISDCRAKGGSNCRIEISYGNGCVAMVFGNSLKNTAGAETKEAAENKAMVDCAKDDTNCHVYYSSCSKAKRVQ